MPSHPACSGMACRGRARRGRWPGPRSARGIQGAPRAPWGVGFLTAALDLRHRVALYVIIGFITYKIRDMPEESQKRWRPASVVGGVAEAPRLPLVPQQCFDPAGQV